MDRIKVLNKFLCLPQLHWLLFFLSELRLLKTYIEYAGLQLHYLLLSTALVLLCTFLLLHLLLSLGQQENDICVEMEKKKSSESLHAIEEIPLKRIHLLTSLICNWHYRYAKRKINIGAHFGNQWTIKPSFLTQVLLKYETTSAVRPSALPGKEMRPPSRRSFLSTTQTDVCGHKVKTLELQKYILLMFCILKISVKSECQFRKFGGVLRG